MFLALSRSTSFRSTAKSFFGAANVTVAGGAARALSAACRSPISSVSCSLGGGNAWVTTGQQAARERWNEAKIRSLELT